VNAEKTVTTLLKMWQFIC